MRSTAGLLLAAIFAVLGLLHVYWAAGGRFAIEVTVPVVRGVRSFDPGPGATLLVAAALFLALLITLGQIGLLGAILPRRVFRWATLGMAVIFFLRAIGEFRLVGFFKQPSSTPFAFWDTWLFSPLCLVIALISLALVVTDGETN